MIKTKFQQFQEEVLAVADAIRGLKERVAKDSRLYYSLERVADRLLREAVFGVYEVPCELELSEADRNADGDITNLALRHKEGHTLSIRLRECVPGERQVVFNRSFRLSSDRLDRLNNFLVNKIQKEFLSEGTRFLTGLYKSLTEPADLS